MKKILALVVVAITAFTLTAVTGAVVYNDSNKDIDIIYNEYTGYKFIGGGDSANKDDIKSEDIAAVKFYIKCPALEELETAVVTLVYNSGTTGWIEEERDLNDGLIFEIPVPELVAGDFFEVALSTSDEQVEGTFSVELLDVDGEVIGTPLYGDITEPPIDETEPPVDSTTPDTSIETTAPVTANSTTSVMSLAPVTANNAPKGGVNIAIGAIMTAVSVVALSVTVRRKKR